MVSEKEIEKYIGEKTKIEDQIDYARASVAKNLFDLPDLTLNEGTPLPKYWHWFFCWETASKDLLGRDGHIKPGNNIIPNSGFPRRMWGGGDTVFLKPLKIGMRVLREITVEDIKYKTGSSGKFCIIQLRNDYKNNENILLTEKQNLIYLPNREKFTKSETKENYDLSSLIKENTFNSQQLFQYSALTMNSHRIHYDLEYCKTTEFYPNLVVHGPLIAQQLVQIADEKLNGDLKKFEFKALNPIFVKEKFSIHLIEKDDCLDLWISDKSGNISMKAKAT